MNFQAWILLLLCCGWSFCYTTMNQKIYSADTRQCISQTESSSLTYLVDTTGSMTDDLMQLKLVNGWLLDRVSARFPCGVRQYTMVEFNDPTIGPSKVTSSKAVFADFFNNISVYGGGDCPELAVAGIKMALETSPPNSFILVLTDASARDYNNASLKEDISSLIAVKHSQIFFLITGLCSDTDDPAFLIYRDIAYQSFGHVFQVSLSELGKVFNYVDYILSRPVNSSIQLFSGEYNSGQHSGQFSVLNNFTSLILTTNGLIYSIKCTGPQDTFTDTKIIVSENWGSMYLVKHPLIGIWHITINGERRFSVRVEGLTATNTSTATQCSECHPNATCEEHLGVLECSCKDGLIGDGFTCSDIDECAYSWSNNCSTHVCINTFGSFECACRNGFTKTSRNICVDVDECANSTLNQCDVLGTCTNTYGGHSCTCPLGYYGDGFSCELDECATDVCGKGMECIKYYGSYSCYDPCFNHTILDDPWRSTVNEVGSHCDIDKIGWYRFRGSGGIRISEYCAPQGSCGTSAPMWINGTHPLPSEGIINRTACAHWYGDCCYWSTNVQIKACPNGYHVYKLNSTPYCTLAYCTDPSSSNEKCTCAEDEECIRINGSYSCYCKEGPPVLEVEDLAMGLTCSTHEMKASFQTCQLKNLNLKAKSVYLSNPSCIGYKDGNSTGVIYALSPLQRGKCGTQLQNNGTHAIYSNTLYVTLETDQIIIRTYQVQMSFFCAYPLDMKLSLETSLRPILSSMSIHIGGTGQFKAEMALYRDESYLSPYEGTEVTLSTTTTLFIGVILDGADASQYAVVMKNCYATPTRNAKDPVKYYFIKERCPNNQDRTIRVFENGISTRGRFAVQMFKFVGDYNLVYLHCEINICDRKKQACKPSCSGIRTRMALSESNDYVLNLGPIVRSDYMGQYSAAAGINASWPLLMSVIFFWIKGLFM